jgi:hypothetical protein
MGFAATPDGMLYAFGGHNGGTEGGGVGVIRLHGAGCAGRSHAAFTRCTAADLALSCGGTKERREETCTRACMCAARQWATHVPLDRGPAMGWYTLGRETERAAAGLGHVCVLVSNVTQPCGMSTWRSCTRGRVKKGSYLYLFISVDGETSGILCL